MIKYNSDKHHRRSIRLRGYDYMRSGAYSVTICTQNRACLFGEIVDGEMVSNDAGIMIRTIWDDIPRHYPGIDIDTFQIMPNHIHGIIIIDPVGAGPRACPNPNGQPNDGQPWHGTGQPRDGTGQPRGVAPTGETITLSLPDVVHRFKTMTTKRYVDGVKQKGWPRFNRKLWQRNYYEHIIRDANELNRIRKYIADNPRQWESDRENPNTANLAETTKKNFEELGI